MTLPYGYRPCGACRELVDAVKGCEHWRPGSTVSVSKRRAERWKARMRAMNAALEVTRASPATVAGLGRDYS